MRSRPIATTTLGLAAAGITLAGLLVAGCSEARPESSSAPKSSEPLQWKTCPDDALDELQCATVPVPLDYDDPDGTKIDLTISKLASKNPGQRRGVLMLNPGGPGATGIDQPQFLAKQGIPRNVLDSYDLIGIDTRGVGHSAPIDCGFDGVKYYGSIPPFAYDDAAFDEQAATAQEVAQRCAANDRDGRLRHITTANMARDMDRVRAALGEDKASFLGYSYGSALGAAYASMFPDTSDRVVLDSNIGDTHLDRDGMRNYAAGMEETFPDFAKWAASQHDRFGLGRTPEEVRNTYLTLADRLDTAPVDGIDGRMFRLSTFVTLYNAKSYETAAKTWQSYLDPTAAAPADPPGTEAALANIGNSWSVFLAVTCNDVQWPKDVDTYRNGVREDGKSYPLYGAAAANIMPCAFWKDAPTEAPVAVEDDGPTNVLVAQNRRDPVTPLRNGERIDEKFGGRSRLLTVEGSGHGAYVLGDNACAQKVVTDYLVDGTMPERDTTC